MNKKSQGFTVIEIIFVALIASFASTIFFIQKNNIEVAATNNAKKSDINSIYYSLEEVFYVANGYYPQSVTSDNLKSVDPDAFKDPNGEAINTSNGDYSYTPLDCNDNKCKKYELKAILENEDDFIKSSRN